MKIGQDFSIIPPERINYPLLNERTCLRNKNGKEIIYIPGVGYSMFTDEPCNSFLTEDDLDSEWTTFNWFSELMVNHNIKMWV